ncbi:MAG: flippase-like domain-containing protein [Chloroflexi bacterium]|nr:flippase-like domain-containing protein [Chloroflexota bacterium]MCI0574951.1 flippase-like domain-containing protein [Chloroflexota bacterium]MCI0645861.1 flippase-like domain-containing protein [Chloroflexota bacterium]MCI0725716.1 flippase-like domain-containing protein [Chloroflexota bacterium]
MLKNKKLRGLLQLVLSVALLAFLVSRVGLEAITTTLSDLNWPWYLFAFLLFLLNVVIRAYRWSVLLAGLGERPLFGRLLYLYFVSLFFNNFLPSGFGGDAFKVLELRQERGRGAEALSSVVMDRLIGLLGSSLIAVAALLWNSARPAAVDLPPALGVTIALVSLGIPALFVLLRRGDPLDWLASALPLLRPITDNARVRRLANTIHRYPFPALLKALLASIPFTLSLILAQFAISEALSAGVPFYLFPLFVPLISLITLLPISFNGLGTREGAYILLFVPAGVSYEHALAMSLAFYFLRFATGLVGGILYAIRSAGGIIRAAYANE